MRDGDVSRNLLNTVGGDALNCPVFRLPTSTSSCRAAIATANERQQRVDFSRCSRCTLREGDRPLLIA